MCQERLVFYYFQDYFSKLYFQASWCLTNDYAGLDIYFCKVIRLFKRHVIAFQKTKYNPITDLLRIIKLDIKHKSMLFSGWDNHDNDTLS